MKRLSTASLRNFIAVAETGSFSGAASRLGVSQPAISLSIKHIEDEYSLELFDRSHGGCLLTEEGTFLLDYAREVVKVEDRFYEALDRVRKEIAGRFEIISSNIPGEHVLPSVVGEFKEAYPKIELVLDISDSVSVIDEVETSKKEIGFTGVRPKSAKLTKKRLCPDTLLMVAPAGHPLVKKREVGKDDLQKAVYVLREEGSGTRRLMNDALEKLGVRTDRLNVAMELSSTSSVLSAVEGGAGLSMTSCLAAHYSLAEKKVVPIRGKGLVFERDLFMVYRKDRTPSRAGAAFIEFIEDKRPFLMDIAEKAMRECRRRARLNQ